MRLVKSARTVVAAIVKAGRDNRKKEKPISGDALTEYYVRAAAAAARKLPEKQSAPAFLLAIGVGLDNAHPAAATSRYRGLSGSSWRANSEPRRAAEEGAWVADGPRSTRLGPALQRLGGADGCLRGKEGRIDGAC